MRKFLSIVLVFALVLSLPMTVFAGEKQEEINESYEEYLKLVDDGILGEDVPYEYWCEIIEMQNQLEASLENSDDFRMVAEIDGNSESLIKRFQADEIVPNRLGLLVPTTGLRAGDILITNATSSSGLFGHAGIAVSPYVILHIAGPGQNPKLILFTDWFTKYENGWTKVYRHSSSTTASAAANWAYDTYAYSNAEYQITMNLASTDVTYCSKIVWQAYYYGPSSHCANGPTIGIRLPYDLPVTIHNVSLFSSTE